MMINLESSRPPTLVDVQSGTLCAGGGALRLRGQDLRDGATVLLNGVPATSTSVEPGGAAATATSRACSPQAAYDLTVKNLDSCQATLPQRVRVIPGPSPLSSIRPPRRW